MSDNVSNLDSRCAEAGFAIVRAAAPSGGLPMSERAKLEGTITKALGVLQENGVYAFFLFLEYQKGEKGARETKSQALALLRHAEVGLLSQEANDSPAIRQLTEDLDSLLLARQLIEQTLIYARYHAKALEETT